MTFDQVVALAVLVAVVGVLIHGKARADIVALTGAAVLLLLGVVRPVEVQGAFASPAVIALAGLFVIAYAIELSGLLGLMIRKATDILLSRPGVAHAVAFAGLDGATFTLAPNSGVAFVTLSDFRERAKAGLFREIGDEIGVGGHDAGRAAGLAGGAPR